MILTEDFKEFFALLNKNDVRYLIVGGYAAAWKTWNKHQL